MTYLFLFTLGPVQSFIAQARKVHDLYSGSRILSKLCKEGANHFLSDEVCGQIVFPDIRSESIPNRFLGKITCAPEQLNEIGNSVAEVVRNCWRKKFDEPQNGQKESLADLLNPQTYQVAKNQIEHHLDIQWLFHLLADETDETYRKAYDELNKNLNALKNSRSFFTCDEKGRKCSLDGERNVIFYRKTEKQTKDRKNVQYGNPLYSKTNVVFESTIEKGDLIQLRHLQPGEGLSAVSMLKRFQEFRPGDFPDTAEFALSDTMHNIGKSCVEEMITLFEHDDPKHLNWQLFFEENLTEQYFKKQGLPISKRDKAEMIQKKLKATAGEHGRKLEKYYALVVFDGDHMGEWWKGSSRLKLGVHLEVFQKDLTSRLAEFASVVQAEYPKDDHRGWVIYAGGDDFLGFFNLHHLVKAMDFLHVTYQKIVHDQLSNQINGEFRLTFSAGVCIAHYKEPLSLVLTQARELEKDAKNLRPEKKDSIGIGVIPGSGQIAEVVLSFEDFTNLGKVINDLKSFDNDSQKLCFSNAFVSKARIELGAFVETNGSLNETLLIPSNNLLDRAVNRACNLTRNVSESEENFKKRKSDKVEQLQIAVKNLLLANKQKLTGFFDALDIADFVERQTHISTRQAEPTEV